MFVSKKTPNNAVMPESSIVLIVLVAVAPSTMSTIELSGITALFGVFLETNKHQNLTRLKSLLHEQTSKSSASAARASLIAVMKANVPTSLPLHIAIHTDH